MSDGKRPTQPDGATDVQTHGAGDGQRDPQPILTTRQGHPVHNNQAMRTIGPRGPATLDNYHFLEKMASFDRERIPERVVHARGFVAYGTFEAYGTIGDEPASTYTRAKLFQTRGKTTPVVVRFSTVIGGRDSSEAARDPRGFAVKFKTEDGNWDLVGQQPTGLLHSRRDQVPRRDPRPQAGPGDVPSGAEPDLRLHEQHARVDAHADLAVQPARHPPALPHHGRLWRQYVSYGQRGGWWRPGEVSLEDASRASPPSRRRRRTRSRPRTWATPPKTSTRPLRVASTPDGNSASRS